MSLWILYRVISHEIHCKRIEPERSLLIKVKSRGNETAEQRSRGSRRCAMGIVLDDRCLKGPSSASPLRTASESDVPLAEAPYRWPM